MVGFIEVDDRMSLSDARRAIEHDLPGMSGVEKAEEWVFSLPDETPISRSQEKIHRAARFAPTILVRRREAGGASVAAQSNRVSVFYGEKKFQTWVTENYRFVDLRQDAARFWGLPCEWVLLTDGSGCNWPDNGRLLQAMASGLLDGNKVFLAPIEDKLADSGNGKAASQVAERKEEEVESLEPSRVVDEHSLGLLSSPQRAPVVSMDERYIQLWNVFTYQCVQGNATRPFHLERKRFSTFLKGIGVTQAQLPVVQRDIIYSVNSTRRAGLDFDGFLNALVDTAVILFPPKGASREGEYEVNAFVEFLSTHVFPMAPSWDTKAWREQEVLCTFDEVHRVFDCFRSPLKAIFSFYAPAVESNRMDMEADRHLTFSSFSAIVLDFQLVDIGIRSHQLAEIFLASAQDNGIRLSNSPEAATPPESFGTSSSPQSSFTLDQSFQRSPRISGVSRNVWDFPELSYDQFVGALLRLALYGYSGSNAIPSSSDATPIPTSTPTPTPTSSPFRQLPADRRVKALLQHFYGVLRMSHVKVILEKRKELIRNPATFFHASMEFDRLFTTMWKAEGRQDYATPEREEPKTQTGREVLAALIQRQDSEQVIVSTLGIKGRENNFAAMAALVETNAIAETQAQCSSVGQEAVLTSGGCEIPTLLRDPEQNLPPPTPVQELSRPEEPLSKESEAKIGAEHPEEKESLNNLRETLTRGYTFIKHSKHSSPHPRQVWCDANLERIYWAPTRKQGRDVKCKSMSLQDVVKVERYDKGLTKKRFSKLIKLLKHRRKKKAKNQKNEQSPDSPRGCQTFGMHVVGKTRTLVLEGHNEAEINAFIQALNCAIANI